MCYTRSFDSYFFLGSLRISIFTLLEEIENERGFPEIEVFIPTRKTNLNLKQICFSGLAQFDSVCVRLPKSHRLS